MSRTISVASQSFPIRGAFTISRGSKTEAEVVLCTIREDGLVGRGECVPYRRYGENIAGVIGAIESVRPALEGGAGRDELLTLLPRGAARNAVDCALWDLEAKKAGAAVWRIAGLPEPDPLTTAFTLSLGSPESMAEQARAQQDRPLLKIKLGTDGDPERMAAVAEAAPNSRIIVDANEGWTEKTLEANLEAARRHRVSLVEQPLPQGRDEALGTGARPVPVCADESVHDLEDLDRLARLYDAVNIKLDKAGGLTTALALKTAAEKRGLDIMIGCMVGTSLGMAPATLLAQGAAFVDLDGPLLLARDREPGLRYEGSLVWPTTPALWG